MQVEQVAALAVTAWPASQRVVAGHSVAGYMRHEPQCVYDGLMGVIMSC